MSWEDQGRQSHGWFGTGTASGEAKDISGGDERLAQRVRAAAYGAIAVLPQALRARAEGQYDAGSLTRLTAVTTAWVRGADLNNSEFAERFFGRAAGDPVVEQLRGAARDIASAASPAGLRAAAVKIAGAMQTVGLDRWQRFLSDAQDRARDPATVTAIEKSRLSADPSKDAIKAVYPIEAGAEIIAAAITGGALPALRAAGGAFFRQILPNKLSEPSGPLEKTRIAVREESTEIVADKLNRYLLNPDHPQGRSKAAWFRQALGFTRANASDLARQLVFDEAKAVQTGVTEYGTTYNQTINVAGVNGRTLPVITGWIKRADGIPRLVTAIPGPKP